MLTLWKDMESVSRQLSIWSAGILFIGVLVFSGTTYYLMIDAKYFDLLSAQPSTSTLLNDLGEPTYRSSSNALRQEGWPLPREIPEGTREVWVYDSRSGRRFYVFVKNAESIIGGFFSSSS